MSWGSDSSASFPSVLDCLGLAWRGRIADMDFALLMLKSVGLLFAISLVPKAIVVSTPFALLSSRRDAPSWREVVAERYREVIEVTWFVAEAIGYAIQTKRVAPNHACP